LVSSCGANGKWARCLSTQVPAKVVTELQRVRSWFAYPFRCAFLAWLCCDEFFDSVCVGWLATAHQAPALEVHRSDSLAILRFRDDGSEGWKWLEGVVVVESRSSKSRAKFESALGDFRSRFAERALKTSLANLHSPTKVSLRYIVCHDVASPSMIDVLRMQVCLNTDEVH
jgi:hypothetical protein